MTGIARYLIDHGLTQKDLARMSGISESAVSRYVAGVQFPRRPHLERIAQATGGKVSANDFIPTATQQVA